MAIKFSQFNLRTDHTEGMYLVGYDGNQNIHITVDNLFDDFINGTENTIAMFGTGGTVLADSILSQNAGATALTVTGAMTVTSDATFSANIEIEGTADFNGNVNLGDASSDLITQTGTLYLNGPIKDTTDTLGAVDQVLLSDATGELTFTDLADLHVGGAEVVEVPVKNVQGSALVKGDPVYISGSVGASGRLEVQLADASNALKMPAVGLLKQDLANNAEGFAVVTGKLRNLITDPIDGVNPTENDVIYVKPSGTSGAALTTTKPVYSNFIQNIGKVGRVSTSNDGNLVVSSILRTNDIPNLTPGRLWVGSTGNTIESQTLFVDEANTRLGIGTATPGYPLDVQTTGSVDVVNIETSGTAGIRIANSNAPFATRITSLNTQTNFKSDGSIEFYTDGAASGSGIARMIIENSTGDVGIGTDPDTRLHVKDDSMTVAKFESADENRSQIILKNAAASNNQAYLMLSTPTTGKKRIALGRTNNPNSKDLLKIENQVATNYTDANMSFGGTGVGANSKFTIQYDYDTDQDSNFNGIYVDANISGTTAITGDRGVNGINVDMDSTATGGNTAQELTLKGINVDVANKTDGDANHLYGVYSSAKNTRTGTGDNMTSITGGYFQAYSSAQSGQVSNMYGVEAITYIEDATHTVNNAYAVYGRTTIDNSFDDTISTRAVGGYFVTQVEQSNDSQVGQAVGIYAEAEVASDISNVKAVEIISDINGGTIGNSYLIRGSAQIVGSATVTSNWGLYLDNIDKNYLEGTLRLPTYGQGNVTGTAAKNLSVDSNGNVIETDGGVVDGSGTANYVSKWSDPNTLTDSVIYDDGTNVGIGTATPADIFHVDGARSNFNGIKIGENGNKIQFAGVDGDIGVGNNNWFILSEGATEVLRAGGSSGRLGIGTASPSKKLHVATTGSVDVAKFETTGNAAILIERTASTQPGASKLTVANNGQLGIASDNLIKFLTSGHSGGTERMRINNDGKIGIGTSAPATLFHIAAQTTPTIRIEDTTNNKNLQLFTDNNSTYMRSSAGTPIYFQTDGANTRMFISSGGQIQFTDYGSGTFTGTATKNLAVDSSGNVIETDGSIIDGSGTANYVSKWSDANTLTDSQIFDNGTNVGIGTASPASKLDVNGGISASGDLTLNDVNPSVILTDTNSDSDFSINVNGGVFNIKDDTNNLARISLKSDGRVGIGTSTPDTGTNLHVLTGTGSGQIKLSSQANTQFQFYGDGNQDINYGRPANFPDPGGDAIGQIRYSHGSHYMAFKANNAERMRINSSGNVGIGTTSPGAKLHVAGGYVRIDDSQHLQFGNGSVNIRNDSAGRMYLRAPLAHYFEGNGSYNMVLDGNSGNLGIGTTSPSEKLEVNGTIKTSTGLIKGSNASAYINLDGTIGSRLRYGNQYITANASNLVFSTNNNIRMTVTSAGDVGIGTTGPTQKLEVNGNMAFTSETSSLTFGGVISSPSLQITNSSSESKIAVFGRTLKLDSYDGIQFLAGGYTNVLNNSGRFGLGTTTPANKLDVAGDIGIDESIIHNGDVDTKFGFVANDNFAITTAGSERVRVTSGGSVGIGTNNPASKLHVAGTALIRNGNLQIDANPSTYPTTSIVFTKNNSTSPAMGDITMSDNPGFQGMMLTARISNSPYTSSLIQIPTSSSKDFKINLLSNDVLTIGSSTKAFKFNGYTSTSVTTTGTLNPNQNYQAPTQDTLADLTVDPSGNVVRGMQEGTWTFTAAEINNHLGYTLIAAPGTNKSVVVYESSWMIKYNATGAVNGNQRYEIRQANNVSQGTVSIFPALKINEILSNSQTMPGGGASAYGFYSRDVPADAGGRTFKTNTATTLHRATFDALPSGVQTVSIKLRYRIYDATTF